MVTVGVRELGDEILVTHHGQVVARIVPAAPTPEAAQRAWDDLDRLAAEISKRWPEGVSAAQAVSEARR